MSEQWAIYLRINPGQQDHHLSLEAQRLRCRKAAQQLGFQSDPTHIWKDVKDSTSTGEPVLDLIRKAVENGDVSAIFVSLGVQPLGNTESSEFGVVAVCSSDPKGDNLLATVAIFRRMQGTGVQIHFVDGPWVRQTDENTNTRIMAFVHLNTGGQGQQEEFTPGRRGGGHGSARAPYGYDYNPITGNWTVNQAEARGVELMFQMAREGGTIQAIAEALNLAGFRTKTGLPWTRRAVSKNLRSLSYTGEQLQGGVLTEGVIPRIISRESFDRVQKTLNDRMGTNRHVDVPFLLTEFIKCGSCKGPVTQMSRVGGPRYYRCGVAGTGCSTRSIRAELLEREAWKILSESLRDPRNLIQTAQLPDEWEQQDQGAETSNPGNQWEGQESNPKWQNLMARYCGRLAQNIDALDRDGKRAVFRKLGVSVKVSRAKDGLSIMVDVVFSIARMRESGG